MNSKTGIPASKIKTLNRIIISIRDAGARRSIDIASWYVRAQCIMMFDRLTRQATAEREILHVNKWRLQQKGTMPL